MLVTVATGHASSRRVRPQALDKDHARMRPLHSAGCPTAWHWLQHDCRVKPEMFRNADAAPSMTHKHLFFGFRLTLLNRRRLLAFDFKVLGRGAAYPFLWHAALLLLILLALSSDATGVLANAQPLFQLSVSPRSASGAGGETPGRLRERAKSGGRKEEAG
eukprot:3105653-Rhodomonas_salina.2